jgi:hypothetical protein
MVCIKTITPGPYKRSSITPVSMGLHSIKKTSRDDVHVLTKAAAKIFCQGVSSTKVLFRRHDLMAGSGSMASRRSVYQTFRCWQRKQPFGGLVLDLGL